MARKKSTRRSRSHRNLRSNLSNIRRIPTSRRSLSLSKIYSRTHEPSLRKTLAKQMRKKKI